MLTKCRPRLSFALGLPDPDLLPACEIADAAASVLREDGSALQYGPPSEELKSFVVDIMSWRGVTCTSADVFLTSGAQQALDILCRLFVTPGAPVICEHYVYTGFRQAIDLMAPVVHSVHTDLRTGVDVKGVANLLSAGLARSCLYINTDGHNPLGVSIEMQKRTELAELAAGSGLMIIEDDVYGLLQYDAQFVPVSALNREHVLYVGSFSKILSPSLRVGWLLAPPKYHTALAAIKEACDINTATFSQRVVCRYLRGGQLRAHVSNLTKAYRKRRDAMVDMLAHAFPRGSVYTCPSSGVFVWVELPPPFDSTRLLSRALAEEGIAFLPGTAFSAGGAGCADRRCLRLNFSHCREDQIKYGVMRLGHMLDCWR